jgi:hypothetical protein
MQSPVAGGFSGVNPGTAFNVHDPRSDDLATTDVSLLWLVESCYPEPESTKPQCMTWPPSTLMVWPVTSLLRADDRKTTMLAMSSGCCHRARGETARTFSSAHSA